MSRLVFPTVVERVDYPESDGEPMAETDLHRDEMAETIDTLKDRYRDAPDVYVAGNLFIYYEEGNPAARFAPDVFVVFGVPKRQRRTYRLWEEKIAPAVVFEFTSRETWLEDRGNKKALCASLGVAEYFMCDPAGEYLRPPLQGFRLEGREYRAIAPDAEGMLFSETLGLRLNLDGGRLSLVDPATGARLLRSEEAREAHRQAEARAAAEQEARRRAEAELNRLRAELDRLR